MASEAPVTAVEAALRQRRRWSRPLFLLIVLLTLVGIAVVAVGAGLLVQVSRERTPHYRSELDHFLYGSIGSETASGLPKALWQVMPGLFPELFDGRDDWSALGFLYETDADGRRRELPIGVSTRRVNGIEMAWLNCAVCHTGTWRTGEAEAPRIVAGMPSNNLDFYRLIRTVLAAGADERLAPEHVLPAMRDQGERLGPLQRLFWTYLVLPQVREGLVRTRSRLLPLLEAQPEWGPGRVDTFNPYKLLHAGMTFDDLEPDERIGTVDFPSIFLQRPREGMQLHWDGNNRSLAERNLSAALGAGVTAETADHRAIRRVADWLLDLPPPPSPHRPDPAAVAAGRTVYMAECAACHGYQDGNRYVFEGARLGTVEPNDVLGADPARLDSYTERFNAYQLDYLFAGTRHAFRHFELTDGYANLPLDGLWLRGPYLHNGSVPTLADLLEAPEDRPVAFRRTSDVVDAERGGFRSPACDPETEAASACFDTRLPGNRNSGHVYGTDLDAAAKADLLAYLLTF
jgi:hypothetical protein